MAEGRRADVRDFVDQLDPAERLGLTDALGPILAARPARAARHGVRIVKLTAEHRPARRRHAGTRRAPPTATTASTTVATSW